MSFGLSAGTIGLIGAGATLASGFMGSQAAGDAADAQAQGAAQADATQRYMYDRTRADNAPFLNVGTSANNKLAQLLGLAQYDSTNPFTNAAANAEVDRLMGAGIGRDQAIQQVKSGWNAQYNPVSNDPAFGSLMRDFSAADMQADPAYQSGLQFGLDEGVKGINRMASATGSTQSGATLKALTRFGNDYASTKANDSYNRFQTNQGNQFNRLSGVSGTGQTAVGQVGAAGQGMANNISQNQIGVGNARAASGIGQANAWSNAIGQGIGQYQNNQLMSRLFPQQKNPQQSAGGYWSNPGYIPFGTSYGE